MFFELALAQDAVDCRGQSEADLRAAHAAVLEHHINDDVEAWLSGEREVFMVSTAGSLFATRSEGRRARREAYLGSTDFQVYHDMVNPVVAVSDDCTMGWVIVQVEARGITTQSGEEQAFAFQSSWVELYRRIEGEWRAVGNVSNFAPQAAE